jgi:predicted nucleic acid-binding protein
MMRREPIRVYADTSVYGGICDAEFASDSAQFFAAVKGGRFHLVTSAVVTREIAGAPPRVQETVAEWLDMAELTELSDEAVELQEAYLQAAVVGPRADADALHVALATIAGCRVIVSWNLKHIVHPSRIPLYNAVNVARGRDPIAIYTPREVIEDGDGDEGA